MSDYKDIFRTPEHQNWFKCSLAVLIAREGLIDFVKDEIDKLRKDVLQKVIQSNSIPEGTTCTCCSTLDTLPCPTRGICQIHHGRCGFHTRPYRKCPNKVCDGLRKEIENQHQFKLPSWKNTDAKLWCSSSWELSKCFLPPDGYSNVKSAYDADFNGLVSILINCKRFSNRFNDDLTKDTNVCTEAREVGRRVRHCATLQINSDVMSQYVDTLTQLLDDPKHLRGDDKATAAREKLHNLSVIKLHECEDVLKQLKSDCLAVTTEDLKVVLDSVLKDTTTSATDQIEKAMADKLQTLKDKVDGLHSEELHKFKTRIEEIKTDTEMKAIQSETERLRGFKTRLEDIKSDTEAKSLQSEEEKLHEFKTRMEAAMKSATETQTLEIETRKLQEFKTRIEEIKTETENQTTMSETEKLQGFRSRMEEIHAEIEAKPLQLETEHYDTLKKELRQDLAYFYQQTRSTMPLSPLIPEVGDNLSKFYVCPNMSQIKPVPKQISSFNELFTNDKKIVRNVYIQGEAGMGKSTLCAKLALVWSDSVIGKPDEDCRSEPTEEGIHKDMLKLQDNLHLRQIVKRLSASIQTRQHKGQAFFDESMLGQFEFVFSVSLRDAIGECDIESMIRSQLISSLGNSTMYNKHIQNILASERCLIILDGLDEWTHESESNICRKSEKIPHGKLWKNTTVLTTTRPWKMTDVRVKDSAVDAEIEVRGITDVVLFITNILKCLNEKSDKTLQYVDFIKEIVKRDIDELMDIPLVLLQLLCLWHDGHELGESKCEIYSNMVDMMCARANAKATHDGHSSKSPPFQEMLHCFRNARFCNKMLLDAFGRLGFFTLHSSYKESRLAFSDYVVKDHIKSDHIVQQALNSGIISQHKSPSLTARKSTFCFLHKTFQEFLAAYFIATNTTESENVMENIRQVYENDSVNMSHLFPFVCGMNPRVAAVMSDIISERYLREYAKPTLHLNKQQMVIDGYKEGVKNGHHKISLSMPYVYYTGFVSHYDKAYLDQLVNMNKDKIVTCVIHPTYVPGCTTSMFDTTSDEQKERKHHAVMLPDNKVKSRRSIHAEESATLQVPSSSTDLGKVPRTRDVIARTLVSQVIPTLTSLRRIDIRYVDLGDTDIPLPNTVQRIEMEHVTMTARACRQLVERISHVPQQVACELLRCTVTPKVMCYAIRSYIQKSAVFTINDNSRNRFQFKKVN